MVLKHFICLFLLGLVVIGGLAQETTTACRLACPFIFLPVCGSNDVTYDNSCVLESTSCLSYVFLIGGNSIMVLKYVIYVFLIGLAVRCTLAQVTPSHCNLACPFNYLPVCASNDLTYSNECVMKSLSCVDDLDLTLKHLGACL